MSSNIGNKKGKIYEILTGLLFSVFTIISYYSRNYEGLFSYLKSGGSILIILLLWLFAFIGFTIATHFIFAGFDHNNSRSYSGMQKTGIIKRLFCKELYKKWGILSIFYIPYYIVYFPGITGADCDDMIHQFFGLRSATTFILDIKDNEIFINNHHPVFDTLLVGGFCKFGQMLGDINIGFAIYAALQMIIVTFTTACILQVIYILMGDNNKWFQKLVFINFALNPLFVMYSLNLAKDTLFMLGMVAFFIGLVEIIFTFGECFNNWKFDTYLFFSLLFSMLTKNQGKYIVLICALITLVFNLKYFKQIIVVFGLALFVFVYLYQGLCFSHFGIKKGLPGEMLTIPAQQTARYLLYHSEDTTELERELFEKVFDTEYMLEKYKPYAPGGCRKSKDAYKRNATKQDLYEFVKIWVKWGLRHPDVYIDALTDSIYLYFDPIRADAGYDYSIYTEFSEEEINNGFDLHSNQLFAGLREKYGMFHENYKNIPVINLIISPGLLLWLFVLIFMWYFSRFGFDRMLIADAFVGLLFLTSIASPVNGSTRYLFPAYYIMPLMFTICIVMKKKGEIDE